MMCVACESFQYISYNNAKFLKNSALNIILARKNQITFYRPQTKLRKGNVFIPVCDSVHRGEGIHPSRQTPLPPGQTPPRQTPPWADHLFILQALRNIIPYLLVNRQSFFLLF